MNIKYINDIEIEFLIVDLHLLRKKSVLNVKVRNKIVALGVPKSVLFMSLFPLVRQIFQVKVVTPV